MEKRQLDNDDKDNGCCLSCDVDAKAENNRGKEEVR
jgi:hypothetical protein